MINVYDKDGNFTAEFKSLVDNYIKEQIEKITTDGKFDRKKEIEYININNYLKEHKDG